MRLLFYPTRRGALYKRSGWKKKGFNVSSVKKAKTGFWFFRVYGINGFHRKGQKELFYD